MISMNRSLDWNSRSPNLFFLSSLTQVPNGLMHCRDEVGKLADREFVVADVFAHDLGYEIRVVSIGVHEGISKKRVFLGVW
jgi:hypothetical protein